MAVDQWASVRPFFSGTAPAGLGGEDAARVQAYDVYENMYWNTPGILKITPRSEDASPVYLPSARAMVDATHRFLGIKWDYLVNPGAGVAGDQEVIRGLFQKIWARETMYRKYSIQKRNALTRGDALWHITANPLKAEGERISIHVLHPGQYFTIVDEDDPDKIIGCHIVDVVPNPNDRKTSVNRRQTYRQDQDTRVITSETTLFELGKWDDRDPDNDISVVKVISPPTPLPAQITQLPVYHIRNIDVGTHWGSSELRGVETLIQALSGTVSDQDLAIALQGLGLYFTDGGPPRDADGNPVPLNLSPGDVVEVPAGSNFGRVQGVSSLPGIEHMNFLRDNMQQGLAIPDIAAGRVDVTVAESGVSLALQMAPIIAKNAEKEQEMIGVYDQMFYDLQNMWLPAYEGVTLPDVEVTAVVGDAMPINRESEIAEVISLVTSVPPLITIEMAQERLAKLGYEFPEGAAAAVLEQATALSAAADPFGARAAAEAGNPDPGVSTPAPVE